MAHAFTIITTSNETVVYTDYDQINLTTLKHVISFKPDLGTLVESNEILLESGTTLVVTGGGTGGGVLTASFTGDSFVIIDQNGFLLVNLFVESLSTTAGVEDIILTNSSGTVLRVFQGFSVNDDNAVGFAIKDSDGGMLKQFYLSSINKGLSTDTFTLISENSPLVTGLAVDSFVTEGSITTIEVELETSTDTGGLLLETGDDVRFEDFTFSEFKTLVAGEPMVFEDNAGGANVIMETPDGTSKLVPEDFATGLENHLVLETASNPHVENHHHHLVGEPHKDGDGHTAAEHRELALWPYRLKLLIARERLNNAS